MGYLFVQHNQKIHVGLVVKIAARVAAIQNHPVEPVAVMALQQLDYVVDDCFFVHRREGLKFQPYTVTPSWRMKRNTDRLEVWKWAADVGITDTISPCFCSNP